MGVIRVQSWSLLLPMSQLSAGQLYIHKCLKINYYKSKIDQSQPNGASHPFDSIMQQFNAPRLTVADIGAHRMPSPPDFGPYGGRDAAAGHLRIILNLD